MFLFYEIDQRSFFRLVNVGYYILKKNPLKLELLLWWEKRSFFHTWFFIFVSWLERFTTRAIPQCLTISVTDFSSLEKQVNCCDWSPSVVQPWLITSMRQIKSILKMFLWSPPSWSWLKRVNTTYLWWAVQDLMASLLAKRVVFFLLLSSWRRYILYVSRFLLSW